VDEFVKVFDEVIKLISILVWPSATVFLLLWLGPSLVNFLSTLAELSLKVAGVDVSMKKAQAATFIGMAEASKQNQTPEENVSSANTAINIVSEAVTPRILRRAQRTSVLWVDDNPDNNVYERKSLEALGISFDLSLSTEDALDKLKRRSYDAIISDMGRPPDPKAGYTLLDRLRKAGDQTPFIIYAGSRSPEHRAEARRRGAIGCTNRANELFEMVLSALGRGPAMA